MTMSWGIVIVILLFFILAIIATMIGLLIYFLSKHRAVPFSHQRGVYPTDDPHGRGFPVGMAYDPSMDINNPASPLYAAHHSSQSSSDSTPPPLPISVNPPSISETDSYRHATTQPSTQPSYDSSSSNDSSSSYSSDSSSSSSFDSSSSTSSDSSSSSSSDSGSSSSSSSSD